MLSGTVIRASSYKVSLRVHGQNRVWLGPWKH